VNLEQRYTARFHAALVQSARLREREEWTDAWNVFEVLPGHLKITPEVLQARVAILLESSEGLKALKFAQSVAEAFPQRPEVLFRLACAYGANGRNDEAREAAMRCVDLDWQWRERVLDEEWLEGIW